MIPAKSPKTFLIALAIVGGAGAAGIALWSVSRGPEPVSAPEVVAAPGGPGLPHDHARDRELTASAEAFQVYEAGLDLYDRLPVQAAARFRRAVTLDPAFAPAHYHLAMASVLTSRRDEAQKAARSAEANQERLPEPYRTVLPVLRQFVDGALDLAQASLGDALARQPSDPDLRFLAGTICAASCDYFDPNGVIEHFERVISVDPEYPGVRPALLEAYAAKGMYDWALARALEYQSRAAREAEAIAELGRVRMARGEYGDAIEAADEIVRSGEDVLAHGLAPAFILTGHHDQVVAMYDPEAERANSAAANVLTHLHAGINDVWIGRFGKAIEHFERGAEFLPSPWERSGRARFFLLLARTHSLLGRSREAGAAAEAARQVAGPRPVLEYALGVSLLKAGDRAGAERVVYRLGLELRPSQPGWTEPWRRLMMGEVALAAGDLPRALDAFREAWQLQRPLSSDCIAGHSDAYFLDALGRGYLAARRPQEALQAFEQIRALGIKGLNQPEIAVTALYRSGRALEELGRSDEARARYAQFVRLWGRADPAPRETGDAEARLTELEGDRR